MNYYKSKLSLLLAFMQSFSKIDYDRFDLNFYLNIILHPSVILTLFSIPIIQGGRGHWTINYTDTQSFIIAKSYSLAQKLWVLEKNFKLVVVKLFKQQFKPTEVVIYHWGWI